MRSIFMHMSSLIGLLVFLSHLWRSAAVEETVLLAFGAGLAVYVVLVLGYALGRRIVAPPASPAAPEADAPEAPAAPVATPAPSSS